MPRADRAESRRDARTRLPASIGRATTRWAAAALLHDVGKTASGLGTFGRGRRDACAATSVIRTDVGGRTGAYLRHAELGAEPSKPPRARARDGRVGGDAPRPDALAHRPDPRAGVRRPRRAPTVRHNRGFWRHRPLLWREFCRRNRCFVSASGAGAGPAAAVARRSTDSALASAMSAPSGEPAVDLGGIGFQLVPALLHGPENLDHRIGHRALERAVLAPGELLLDVRDRLARHRGVDLDQVRDARAWPRGRGAPRSRSR